MTRKMQQKTYTIVGLRHHAWQGEALSRRLSQAAGKRVVLTSDDDNPWNGEATLAWIDIEPVGHVKNDECHEATAFCRQMEEHVLQGRVTRVDVEHRQLEVTVGVADGMTAADSPRDEQYDAWYASASGVPELGATHDEQRLHMLQYDLAALLTADEGLDDNLRRELEVYESLMTLDISREATLYRHRIVNLMLRSRHADVRAWGRRMDYAVTAMGAPETAQQLGANLCSLLPSTRLFADLLQRSAQTDLSALEAHLRRFPHGLYQDYASSPATLMAKLYYRRVPRHPLRRFLTGLLLLDRLRGGLSQTLGHEQAVSDMLDYVAQIDHCATPQWQGQTDGLWRRIAALYRDRITDTHGAKATTFNRRFTCQLVGTLLQLGVYRKDVYQTDYTCLLEGDRRSSLRKNINQGVDDGETRQTLRTLLGV